MIFSHRSSISRIPNIFVFLLLASSYSTTTTNAFTIQVKDYECQDRSIMADFTDVCNDNMTCTFGETAYISGVLNMTDDVSSSWGVTEDTTVYLDSTLHIATYQTRLLTMQPISLCTNGYLADYEERRRRLGGKNSNNYYFSNYNSGSSNSCPSAGLYQFQNVGLPLPSVPNKVYDWAATGWTGSISIDMYLDSSKYQLVGRCQLNVVTHMDGNTNTNSTNGIMSTVFQSVPEASVTGMIVLGTFAALAFLGFAGYSMSKGDLTEEEETAINFQWPIVPKVEVA